MPHRERTERERVYSAIKIPSLSMSELVLTTLDHDATDMLIDKWLEHRSHPPTTYYDNYGQYGDGCGYGEEDLGFEDAYHEWFREVSARSTSRRPGHPNLRGGGDGGGSGRQAVLWTKGEFAPENVFCRTVDTGRLIPLDRTWRTHVYHHRTMLDRKLSMLPVVFTMLPELMLLRGMHDLGCDDIYVIVTDLKKQEMDDVSEYFKLVCRHAFGRTCKLSMERRIQAEHMRITHTLARSHRTPCFPQIDLTLRALLHAKKPPFIILFSHQTSIGSYSQILFTHPSYVPDEEVFYDYPTGCPNRCCVVGSGGGGEECEMIRFPRRGAEGACVLDVPRTRRNGRKRRKGNGCDNNNKAVDKGGFRKFRERWMCNWVECDVCFVDPETLDRRQVAASARTGSSDSSSRSPERDDDVDGASNGSGGSADPDHDGSSESSEGHNDTAPSTDASTTTICPSSTRRRKTPSLTPVVGQICSKCRLVKYCSLEHQRLDWDEHRRVCVKMG